MEKHITILAVLYIVCSALGILAAMIVFVAVAGGGLISGDPEAIAITAGVGTVIALFLTIISVPGIIGGIGLLKRKEWARILVLILGFMQLLNIPIGTALGIYTIWALMNRDMVPLFMPLYGSSASGSEKVG
jgi:membrane protease YdiL (CAAX protease family)